MGQTYTHIGVLSIDPINVRTVHFEWDHEKVPDLDLLHIEKMHVDQIELIGLSSSQSTTKSAANVLKFCTHSNAIHAKQQVEFSKC